MLIDTPMTDAYICDAIRTPIGRYGGALKDVRADDLGAVPLKAIIERVTVKAVGAEVIVRATIAEKELLAVAGALIRR